jgi:hypothetical protein
MISLAEGYYIAASAFFTAAGVIWRRLMSAERVLL